MMCKFKQFSLIVLGVISTGGCAKMTGPKDVELAEIYQGAAQREDINRRPVIVIPGILGSKLIDENTGQIVWGAFTRDAANPSDPESARLFAYPIKEGARLSELNDSVRSDGALEQLDISLFPALDFSPKAYFQMFHVLGAGGYRDADIAGAAKSKEEKKLTYSQDHYNCFQFDYDWRRSCAENASLLAKFVKKQKAYVEAENYKRYGKKGDVKFNIVAHSMGGLVARYFLRYGDQGMPVSGKPNLNWSGAKDVNKLIMVGTPNGGSIKAANQLVNGMRLAPFIFEYSPAMIGSVPAVYELLPRARHGVLKDGETGKSLDPLDPNVWFDKGWGLADPDQADAIATLLPDVKSEAKRSEVARKHLVKCLTNARRFQQALDRPSRPPEGLELILFCGDTIKTAVEAEAWPGKIKMTGYAPGDDTVARYSAVMDERFASRSSKVAFKSPIHWNHSVFLSGDHLGITKSRTFADNILFDLLELP